MLICGDRNWTSPRAIALRMKTLPLDCVVITGGARGADKMAHDIAQASGRLTAECEISRAAWDRLGPKAGPIRNRLMLSLAPDLVLAFHADLAHSKGTKDCVTAAEALGIPVEVITG